MARFLTGGDLTAAIKSVLCGNHVRCAVAFWGLRADTLFPQTKGNQPRIICDVTLGGTSSEALRALGAPRNDLLKHIPGFHAKVYISDRGAVVGSANVSENGVGLDGPPSLVEAGTLHGLNELSFGEIEVWFEENWKKAEPVDDSAMMLATKRFRSWSAPNRQSVSPASLLGLIAADPNLFSDVSIVIVGTPVPPAVQGEICLTVKENHPEEIETIDSLDGGGIFSGWGKQDLNRWRRVFIELWMPRERLFVYGRKVMYCNEHLVRKSHTGI